MVLVCPSSQRKLGSILISALRLKIKSKMDPSFRWDDVHVWFSSFAVRYSNGFTSN